MLPHIMEKMFNKTKFKFNIFFLLKKYSKTIQVGTYDSNSVYEGN